MQTGEKEMKLHQYFIRHDKKNTRAVFLSFALTFLLLTALLVLMHTNHRIGNIQLKAVFTPADCNIEGLSSWQVGQLQNDPEIAWAALEQETYGVYRRNGQNVFLEKNDEAAITMMTKLVDGRLPQREGEIASEGWVLLNLGIEPVIGQNVTITDGETGEEKTFHLVGILSDSYGNKKYGTLHLYTALDRTSTEPYVAYVRFLDSVDYRSKVKRLKKELGIAGKQIKECPARENLQELYGADVGIGSVILFICMVVFYGVYRIASLSRARQYGILRAIGMKRRQFYRMILLELYAVYWVSVPVGILGGLFAAWLVMLLSGDRDTEVYLCNEAVPFRMVVPVWQIMACVILAFLLISMIGYLTGRKFTGRFAIDTVAGKGTGRERRLFLLQNASSKAGTLFRMGGKYIFRDFRTSGFAILVICLEVTLFTGLAYQAGTLRIYREDTREMYYLNGEYALSMLHYSHVSEGLSRESAEKIEGLEGITSVRTSSGLPVRVVDEDGVERNEAYYNELNETLEEVYGYGKRGYDGKNQVYQSMLLGYNAGALQELEKYVVEGETGFKDIGEDEVVLSVLRMDDTKRNRLPGFYKEGTPLMEYHAGDKITVKYRADLDTASDEYERMEDYGAAYVYKTYQVKAIVFFDYMFDCNKTVYPLLITHDRYIREIAPESGIQCMYCDGASHMGRPQQNVLEKQLIRISSRHSNVSARSLISEIKQNEMFYHKQMVYIYGISIITFLLAMINMANNFRYRMQKRTRDICMLRAIGMSVSMAKRMMLFENLILGMAAVPAAFVLSHSVLQYLYKMSDMRSFGHGFHFAYVEFFLVSAGALAICVFLSFGILESWKTRRIMEGVGRVE